MSQNVSTRQLAIVFAAGFIATVVGHQLLLLVLDKSQAYSMQPTWPLGVPSFISLSFFGGLWAIAFVYLLPRMPAALQGVIGWIVLGAILPSLVFLFVVAPLKGIFAYVTAPGTIVAILILNAVWGLCSWALIELANRTVPKTA